MLVGAEMRLVWVELDCVEVLALVGVELYRDVETVVVAVVLLD